jgi:hypothetical protein
MRKLRVGLMLVGLLAVTTPGMAQVPGSMDPLGLITSGAVLPYLGQGALDGAMSFLEVYAPVSGTSVHMFFFDVNCVRTGESAGVELTTNDVEIFRLDNTGPLQPTTGLVTIGSSSADGFSLEPLNNPIHARVLWVNTAQDFARVLEPIAISTIDNDRYDGTGTWSPLRTGATFFAPVETGGFHTTLYFVCPNTNIHGASSTSAFPNSRFPQIVPGFQLPGLPTPLRFLVFDDDEAPLRDVVGSCNCLTIKPVTDISSIYADASDPERVGTYTEVVGGTRSATPAVCDVDETENTLVVGQKNPGNVCQLVPTCVAGGSAICVTVPGSQQFRQITAGTVAGGPFSFTAYRAITAGGFDIFGRLSTANRCDLQPLSDATLCDATGGR